MENLFEGGIPELEQIKFALEDESRKSLEMDQAADALRAKEKEIEEENRNIEDRIQEVLKTKRDAVFEPYNQEVEKANLVLKDSIRQREAAKEAAVSQRISRETSSINEKNIQLDFSAKTLLKNAGMPSFCRKGYYFSLFAPKTAKDYVTFIISAIIAFVVIPIIVILLVDTTTLGKIFIYVGIVVFFVLVYLAIFFWTQPNKNRKTLELVRPDIESIKQNSKEMRKLTRGIRHDKDESSYGLEELDNEIVRNRGVYDEALARRDAALKQFEEDITPQVREEVTAARAEIMEKLVSERDVLKADYTLKEEAATSAEKHIQQNYTSYIGKKNMSSERIDQLIGIIKDGKATNIIGALDVQKEESRLTNRLADAAEKIKPEDKKVGDVEVAKADTIKTDFSTIYEEDKRNREAATVSETAEETQTIEENGDNA